MCIHESKYKDKRNLCENFMWAWLYRSEVILVNKVVDFTYLVTGKMPRYSDRYSDRYSGSSTRLYVGHLSSRTRTYDLEDLFSRYGR